MANNTTYYLGCDVSLRSGGYCIIGVQNRKPFLVKKTTIKTSSKMHDGEALRYIYDELNAFTEGFTFRNVIREKGFSRFNKATQQVFKATAIVHLSQCNHNIIEISPTTIKKVIGATGKAEKEAVLAGVCGLLNLSEDAFIIPPSGRRKKPIILDDESDACGVVLTYLLQENLIDVCHLQQSAS